jgi:hypothetical protein
VTPDKLAAWLKEDILLRRVPVRRPRARARPRKGVRQSPEQVDTTALMEVKSLAETLEVPVTNVIELLTDDREGYVPLVALSQAVGIAPEGTLYTKGTIDAYIAAVIELWRLQVAHESRNTENPYSATIRGFLE